jgi:hypothetical protein
MKYPWRVIKGNTPRPGPAVGGPPDQDYEKMVMMTGKIE